ncbi:segregation and condensation protein B [Levilactobacillus namurensis]|nr:SMC-Scp complex subunit ScpB [Levilactobacillus namurensis]PTM22441.1 SMC-Scp complex subunit ScpB [Lactobacillus sp. PFC-70]MCW3777370.1 SMC-Scp complex subunit ScpB [Levilactobacillus namurensis]MDT7014504.1 SMC-Scp complex subunit ScpB [Levilactobacillus namurensis]MDT7018563.1 SMC-Scp complex subunit ScpB [Levilactobacillus namurensis]WNN64455.1 SMC-Scp complex subunit ScpB [Levilactobacillus namurensis]
MTPLAQIEGLLFVSGDEGMTVADLATVTGLLKPAVLATLERLAQKYAADTDSALELMVNETTYRLVTKEAASDLIKRYFESPLSTTLSQASLEVLAIIAYRQPITRIEIDEIRGVQSASTVQKLVLRRLIEDAGRLDEPGRPKLYRTSAYFLDYFGLQQLTDLPPLPAAATPDPDGDHPDGDLFLQAFNQSLNQSGDEN